MSTKPYKPKVTVEAARATRTAKGTGPVVDTAHHSDDMGQVRKSVLFLGVVIIGYALYLLFTGQIDEFLQAMVGVKHNWIIAALICYVAYFVLGVSAYVLSVIKDPTCPVGIRDLMGVEASGIFFMNLTPNGTGAAPAQIFRLTKSGLSIGQAGALQYTRFVIYEAAEGLFAALMLIFRGQYFYENFGDVTLIGIALFGFKIVQVLFMLAICLRPRWAQSLGTTVIKLGARVKLIKHPEKMLNGLTKQVQEFAVGFRSAAKNVKEMLLVLLVTMLQLGCLYSLPFFVLNALGLPADLLTCIASGAMLELLTSAIPLPGGTFGAEGGFAFLFARMFGPDLAAGFVLWRSVEYFIPTFAAGTLLGLRSTSRTPIAVRWTRRKARLRALYQRIVTGKAAPTHEIRVKPPRTTATRPAAPTTTTAHSATRSVSDAPDSPHKAAVSAAPMSSGNPTKSTDNNAR